MKWLIFLLAMPVAAYEPQFVIPDQMIDQNFKNISADLKAAEDTLDNVVASTGAFAKLATDQTFTGSNTFNGAVSASSIVVTTITVSSITLSGSNFAWTNAGLTNENSWTDEAAGSEYFRIGKTVCLRLNISHAGNANGLVKSGFPPAAAVTYFMSYSYTTAPLPGFTYINTSGQVFCDNDAAYIRGSTCYEVP